MVKVHYLDKDRLGIVSGVPVPGPQANRTSRLRNQLKACKVGDSFITDASRGMPAYFAKRMKRDAMRRAYLAKQAELNA